MRHYTQQTPGTPSMSSVVTQCTFVSRVGTNCRVFRSLSSKRHTDSAFHHGGYGIHFQRRSQPLIPIVRIRRQNKPGSGLAFGPGRDRLTQAWPRADARRWPALCVGFGAMSVSFAASMLVGTPRVRGGSDLWSNSISFFSRFSGEQFCSARLVVFEGMPTWPARVENGPAGRCLPS